MDPPAIESWRMRPVLPISIPFVMALESTFEAPMDNIPKVLLPIVNQSAAVSFVAKDSSCFDLSTNLADDLPIPQAPEATPVTKAAKLL